MRWFDSTTDPRSHAARAVIYLIIGVVLLSPAFTGPFSDLLGQGDQYTYEAVEVTTERGWLDFKGPMPNEPVRGIDCLRDYSRLCGLEVAQLDGNVSVREIHTVWPQEAPYVQIGGEYYLRTQKYNQSENTIEFGLRPVSMQTVLEGISIPVDYTKNPTNVWQVLSRGNATIDHQLSTPRPIIRHEDSYYVYVLTEKDTIVDWKTRRNERVGTMVNFVLGLWLLRRGWVHYDHWNEY